MLSIPVIIESFMLVLATTLDAFVASFAYGTNKIKIPMKSVVTINVICSFILAFSLFLGSLIGQVLPDGLGTAISFVLLFLLGLTKLCEGTIRTYINRTEMSYKEVSFSLMDLKFILQVFANPEAADKDQSKSLSPKEAASLAIALSLDGLGVGIGAALANVHYSQVIILTFLTGTLAVLGGCYLGNKFVEKFSIDLSWLSGILLIILAFLKL